VNITVFTYGTLEIPAVMEAVTGKSFPSIEATVENFARYVIKGKSYPGMTPAPGQATAGRLYYEVDPGSLALLDRFEDKVYVRQLIPVKTGKGESLEAYAYIIPPPYSGILSSEPWHRDRFMASHLPRYLTACQAFHQEALRHRRGQPSGS